MDSQDVTSKVKIAIVYDWIDKWGGVERALLLLHEIFPQADFYSSYFHKNNAKWANKLNIKITNPGPVAIYNLSQKVYFDNKEVPINNQIDILLPFQTYKSYIDIPFSFLAAKTPDKVRLVIDGEEVSVSTNKQEVIIYNLLFIFVVSLLILLTIIFRLKKWKIFPNLKRSK